MIRNGILYDIAPGPSPLKSREELALEARALQALTEYRLVKDGVARYEDLGYGVAGGGVSMVKQLEYLAIDAERADALEEKQRRSRSKK